MAESNSLNKKLAYLAESSCQKDNF